jgi:POT family proton-dependent oligopeptide transporter
MLLGLMLMLGKGSFLIGLIPFALGTGLLKGNLSAQLGMLYADEARRRQAYTAYLGFLNAGTIGGPLVCGAGAVLWAGLGAWRGGGGADHRAGLLCAQRGGSPPASRGRAG